MARKVNKEARIKALHRVWTFAKEDKNIESDFIIDRDDFDKISDVDLAKEMAWVEKMLMKHIDKILNCT